MKTPLAGSNLLSFLLVLIGMALPATAAPAAPVEKPSADAPLVADKIREAMQDRRYADAVKAIDEAAGAKGVKDSPRDYLLYLQGRALHLDGKYDEAISAFDRLGKELPNSPWARRARFAKAVSLARKGDFRSAELIYRTEADYLLSTDRKQQIADIYLEFADTCFKPPKEEQKPDYAKALEFYKKALETGADWWKKIDIELLIGQCQQKLGKPAEAAALFEKFIKDHPGDWDGAVCVTVWTPRSFSKEFSRRDIEARWRLGTCRLAEGNPREARRVWQDLLAKYVDSQSPRVADAQFDLAQTWNIPNPEDDEQLNLGAAALRAFLERFPRHEKAGLAHLQIAQSYLNCNRPADAAAAIKQFLADPRCRECKELPEAQNLLGRAYLSQKDFARALAAWREFLAKYPAHNAWRRGRAGDRGDGVPDGPRTPGGQEVCRGQQALWRVPGQVSLGRPQPRDPLADEPAKRGRRGSGTRPLPPGDGWSRNIRAAIRPRGPNFSSPTPWNESSASWKRPWRNIAK